MSLFAQVSPVSLLPILRALVLSVFSFKCIVEDNFQPIKPQTFGQEYYVYFVCFDVLCLLCCSTLISGTALSPPGAEGGLGGRCSVLLVHSYLPPLVSCRELIRWGKLLLYFILSAHLMTSQLTYGLEE